MLVLEGLVGGDRCAPQGKRLNFQQLEKSSNIPKGFYSSSLFRIFQRIARYSSVDFTFVVRMVEGTSNDFYMTLISFYELHRVGLEWLMWPACRDTVSHHVGCS
jgi:hypothetical protein